MFKAQEPCMIALDGEREIKLFSGDEAKFVVRRTGPWRVKPREALSKRPGSACTGKSKFIYFFDKGEITWLR